MTKASLITHAYDLAIAWGRSHRQREALAAVLVGAWLRADVWGQA